MKDPVGLVVALLSLALGVYILTGPERMVKNDSSNPEKTQLKVKKFRIIGGAITLSGVMLLAMHFIKHRIWTE